MKNMIADIIQKRKSVLGVTVRWGLKVTLSILACSVMSFAFISFITSFVLTKDEYYHPIYAIAMIPVMGIGLGVEMTYITRELYQQLSRLEQEFNRVAEGDLDAEIYRRKSDIFCGISFNGIYDTFNKMLKELKAGRVAQQNFMNEFSHEFKTPITSINGFAKLLLDTPVTEEERQEYLQIIADESGRLAELSQNTLLMSKLESQQLLSDCKSYSLDEQLKQCIIILSGSWEAKRIKMEVELSELSYYGNYDLMQQVWLNLLNNAIKFTPEQGTIVVQMQQADNQLEVRITDSGIGMTEDTMEHIFDKYYQADSSHATKGYGLGMSIVKRIVELSEGKIDITSILGKGSTFLVVLPLQMP